MSLHYLGLVEVHFDERLIVEPHVHVVDVAEALSEIVVSHGQIDAHSLVECLI